MAKALARWAAIVVGQAEGGTGKGPGDGMQLCKLVETLTGRKPVPANSSGDNLALVKAAFETMEEAGLSPAKLTCSPEDVASGNEQAVASLRWELAQAFFIAPQFPGAGGQWKGAMMAWCQSVCNSRGVSITDFHKSWQSGLGLCALIDSTLQDPSVINIPKLKSAQPSANVELALSIALRTFDVPPIVEAGDLNGPNVDERAVIVYLALLHKKMKATRSSGSVAPVEAKAMVAKALDESFSDNTMARQSLLKAMVGRPEGVIGRKTPGAVSSEDVARVTALIEELREPINNVAEVLSKSGSDAMSADEAKATFKQLTERMRRLVEVLPDTLECTQEAQALEESIQAELRKVRARAEFEEAYIARLVERQRQCRTMSQVLQQNTGRQMELLRAPLLELLRIVDSKEAHLKAEVVEVENDKVSILQHSQKISEADLERMRSAEARAEAILKTKIVSATWLETGHAVEDILVACEAGRIEGKSDFPESFTDFNCTLDLRLEHNIANACDHALHATDFEERKVLQSAEQLASNGLIGDAQRFSSPAALMIGTSAKDAMVVGGSRQSVRAITEQRREDLAKKASWSMTVDGDWVRIDDSVGKSDLQTSEVERVLAHARRLPPKEADEYLSQDFVRQILYGVEGRSRQSDRILQAAYSESLSTRAPPMGGLSGDYSKAGAEVQKQLAPIVAPAEARVCDGVSVMAIGGWDGNNNLHSLERLGGLATNTKGWCLVGSLSSSRRGLAAAQVGGKVYVMGGWDGTSYLSTVEVYDIASGAWNAAKSMPQPRCFAAATALGGKIYVAGGYYGSYNLDTAEVYDPSADEWTPLPSMSCSRRGLAIAAVGSSIYAVGGWDGKHNLSSVEAYSPQAQSWRTVASLSVPRCSVSAAALGGKLYTCGGWDGKEFLSSVEVLDPTSGEGWLPAAKMQTARSYGAVVAAGGKLLALGGWDGVSARRLDSVEEFSPEKGFWETRPPMTSPRYGLAAVVV